LIKLILIILFISKSIFAETIKIAVVNYPPHIIVKDTKVSGPAIKYVNKILEKIKIKPSYIISPLKRAKRSLKFNKVKMLMVIGEAPNTMKTLERPFFYVVPGLCFKKNNFIPILSAKNVLNGLRIGYPGGINIVQSIDRVKVKLKEINGADALSRGVKMLLVNRFDAFYHPNPKLVYHHKNPLSKKVACSYFYGHSRKIYIAVSNNISKKLLTKLNKYFTQELRENPYLL